MHIREPVVAALVTIGVLDVVESHQFLHGGMQVVNGDGILDDVVREVVRLAVTDAWFDAAASQPDREASGVVVAAVVVLGERSLSVDRSAEFTGPQN